MGYLICQNCKGYYKLRDGEKPEDFTTTCACGGNLRYAINMDVVSTETPPINNSKNEKKEYKNSKNKNKYKKSKTENKDNNSKLIACPDCGHQLSKKAKTCPKCGRKLTYEDLHGYTPRKERLFMLAAFIIAFFLLLLGFVFGDFLWLTGGVLWGFIGLVTYFEYK